MKYLCAAILLGVVMLTAGCGKESGKEESMKQSYTQITQEEAKRMMAADDGHIIVDVRRPDEFAAGHIPGAICIPNETIGAEKPAELPDSEQVILIYCRSGNRSKQAAEKLAALGYTNLYEFGGIITWTGEIVTENDESGPADNSIEESASQGSSGQTPEESAAAETESQPETGETSEEIKKRPVLVIEANGTVFYAEFEDNSSAEALAEKLADGPLVLELSDYGSFEKVGPLPWSLPRNDHEITTVPGDVILYQGNNITIYYAENTWSFTRLARIPGVTQKELLDVFGSGNVTVEFRIEWVEE